MTTSPLPTNRWIATVYLASRQRVAVSWIGPHSFGSST
jgi:hypothetical protein